MLSLCQDCMWHLCSVMLPSTSSLLVHHRAAELLRVSLMVGHCCRGLGMLLVQSLSLQGWLTSCFLSTIVLSFIPTIRVIVVWVVFSTEATTWRGE